MSNDAIEKAREADGLTEVAGKPGLFVVEELTTHRGDAYYLDLRRGFAFYGYNEVGEPIRDGKARPPSVVREIEALVMAEGSARLDAFVRE